MEHSGSRLPPIGNQDYKTHSSEQIVTSSPYKNNQCKKYFKKK